MLDLARFFVLAAMAFQLSAASPLQERGTLQPQDAPACTGCNSACGKFNPTSDDNLYVQWTQVTDPVTCGQDSTCSSAYTTSQTISYSFSGGADIPFDEVSGTFGFSVSESFTTGETSSGQCNPGETACVLWGQQRASHSVEFECTNLRGCLNNGCDGTADVLVNNDAGNPKGCYVTLCNGCQGKGEIISNPSSTCTPN